MSWGGRGWWRNEGTVVFDGRFRSEFSADSGILMLGDPERRLDASLDTAWRLDITLLCCLSWRSSFSRPWHLALRSPSLAVCVCFSNLSIFASAAWSACFDCSFSLLRFSYSPLYVVTCFVPWICLLRLCCVPGVHAACGMPACCTPTACRLQTACQMYAAVSFSFKGVVYTQA